MSTLTATPGRQLLTLGAAGLAVGLGDLSVGAANAAGLDGRSGAGQFYWLGIVLIYVPGALAAWSLRRSRGALVCLTLLLAAGVYLVRVLETPTALATVNELQTLRSYTDVVSTHHLYAVNPTVGTYGRFPGLQIVVVALHQLTGLSFASVGRVVVGLEHPLICLALLEILRRLLKNNVAAYAGVVAYATNSSFVLFDAEVSYESFALPLAIATVYLVLVPERASPHDRRLLQAAAVVIAVTVCVSHHITSYWLAVALLAWSALGLFRRRRRIFGGENFAPITPALVTTAVAILWFALVARAQLGHELGPVFTQSYDALKSTLGGTVGVKKPFSATGTATVKDSSLLRYDGFLAVLISLGLLLLGLREAGRRRIGTPLSLTLFVLALVFPVGLALRLTRASTETSTRTVEFAFIGLALTAGFALLAREREGKGERHSTRSRRLALGIGLPVALAILATGDIVVGVAPYDRYAGTYLIDAEIRSANIPSQQAAAWTALHWPAGTIFTSDDVTTSLYVTAAGAFFPKGGTAGATPVVYVFDSPTIDERFLSVLRIDKISRLVVDERVATTPSPVIRWPLPSAYGTATALAPTLPQSYLDKLDSLPALQRTFDNGSIRIYTVYGTK